MKLKFIEPNNRNQNIYNALPIFLQNFACTVKGFQLLRTRYNSNFKKMFIDFMSRNEWGYDKIAEYRDNKIQQIIEHAYKTVPYYHSLFDDNGINYEEILTIDDLKKIPITTKDDILENYNSFFSTGFKSEKWPAHTSGTTGTGLQFFTTEESVHAQWSTYWRFWSNLGIEYGEWCAVFGNKIIVPQKQHKPPYWRTSFFTHQIFFSGYHENDRNLYDYYIYIKKKKIRWIHGYPSLINALAEYMVSNGLKLSCILWVTTAAESLLPNHKKNIMEAFGVEPKELYGQTEEVAIIHQNNNNELVVDEDFSAVEFIDQKDGTHLIVGTNLYNYAFPFIRYSTKDTVVLSKTNKSKDFRKVESIDGRIEDYIYLPDGTKVGKLYNVFEDTKGFKEVQLHQNEDYSITIYAVKRYDDISDDEKKASDILRLTLGKNIKFKFVYVDKVPRTNANKFRFIVSDIHKK